MRWWLTGLIWLTFTSAPVLAETGVSSGADVAQLGLQGSICGPLRMYFGVNTLGELTQLTIQDLSQHGHVGSSRANRIREAVESLGWKLGRSPFPELSAENRVRLFKLGITSETEFLAREAELESKLSLKDNFDRAQLARLSARCHGRPFYQMSPNERRAQQIFKSLKKDLVRLQDLLEVDPAVVIARQDLELIRAQCEHLLAIPQQGEK